MSDLRTKGMESGHRMFLVGVALLLLGFLVTIPAIFTLTNLTLMYAGFGLSLIGSVLLFLGIHIFMGQTTVEVRDILRLPSPNRMPARAPALSEDAAPRRLGASERMLIIIVVASLLFTLLLFFLR